MKNAGVSCNLAHDHVSFLYTSSLSRRAPWALGVSLALQAGFR